MRRKSKAYPSEERRQMATKKREAAKEKAQQATLKRQRKKSFNENKSMAVEGENQ